MYTILHVDIDTRHEISHVIHRKGKANLWEIICFVTDCMVMTEAGMQRAQPGDCFIKSPDFIEYRHTPVDAECGFTEDWLYLAAEEMEGFLGKLGLPVNRLIRTHHPLFLRAYLQRIIRERNSLLPLWEYKCSNLAEAMLLHLAQSYKEYKEKNTIQYKGFLQLRNRVWTHLEEDWSVARMAGEVGLSCSRFSVLYKMRFGKSPNEDLIELRMEKAKNLLLSTNWRLNKIARVCGFQNESYFSRVFKMRTGVSPDTYRRELPPISPEI